jgi:hypothetical protein
MLLFGCLNGANIHHFLLGCVREALICHGQNADDQQHDPNSFHSGVLLGSIPAEPLLCFSAGHKESCSRSTKQMPDQGDQEKNQEEVEEDFSDASRGHCDSRKTQHGCDQCDNKERQSPSQHVPS